MQPVLGIVLVHYNTPTLLRGCLSSLQRCTLPRQIVVVDNASPSPEGVELVRREFPDAWLVVNAENRGFARATNQGLQALGLARVLSPSSSERDRGRGDREVRVRPPHYALLLNPDTVVQEGALESLVEFMEAHRRAGAAGPRLLNPDGSIQGNAFTFPTLLMTFFDFFPLHGRLYHSRLNGRYRAVVGEEPFPIGHPLGACLLLRSEALAQVGLLDEEYFMYVEEVDICYRLKRAGWEVYHVPTARVIHYGGQSTRQLPERMFVELHRSRYRFFHRYYSSAFRWAHRRLLHLGLWWRALQDRRAQREGRLLAAELAGRLAAYREIAAMR